MSDELILRAARLAAIAHKGQNRKWARNAEPYILHPLRVAGLVALHPYATAEMVAAAYLHDAVEDAKNPEAIKAMIEEGLGLGVLNLVMQLTNASKLDSSMKDKPRAERKAADRAKIAACPWDARYIKLCDRLDNLKDMLKAPTDFVEIYKNESRLLLEALKGTDNEMEAELAKVVNA